MLIMLDIQLPLYITSGVC
uniref:Uncharacterized protein n=1 Tax=Anguilla anguilla TaxID=7936 RepID=A0A0E9UF55_ANGAN